MQTHLYRMAAKQRRERRFQRQFEALERLFPPLRGPMSTLRKDSWFPIRFPVALLLIAGGIFSFLPVLGIWMLPLGLLLLAVDLPALRPPLARLLHWIERKWPHKAAGQVPADARPLPKSSAEDPRPN
jgi:hypothetical protein